MDDKQTRTLKRLIKKLSALRVTLTKSERELLDTLILGAPAGDRAVEVEGHAMAAGRAAAGIVGPADGQPPGSGGVPAVGSGAAAWGCCSCGSVMDPPSCAPL